MTPNGGGLLFTNVRVASPLGMLEGWLRTDGPQICALGRGASPSAHPGVQAIDGRGGVLQPGFVDVHTHGALGRSVMEGDPEGLREMARFFATTGVTSFLATTFTADDEATLSALAAVAAVMRQPRGRAEARLLGAHLEGPYLNPARAGAHRRELVRAAMAPEALRYLDSDVVRLVTLAPEIPENEWFLDECVARAITVSAGHTEATFDEMASAVLRGVRHVTHTFNAMLGVSSREPGTVGAALTLGVRCELIADNVHVHPTVMRMLFELCGPDGTVLITDASPMLGLPDGEYSFDARTVVAVDGTVRLRDGGLAGSVLTMDRAVRNLAGATGRHPGSLWRASSANAAASAGVADRLGALAAGYCADLVLLDDGGEVQMTVIDGEIAYTREVAGAGDGRPALVAEPGAG